MAVSTGNEYLWAFLRYARANPHDSLNSVHYDELDAMAQIFSRVNETDGNTAVEADPAPTPNVDTAAYGANVDIPGKTTANTDTAGISFETPLATKTDQARYPQSHIFTSAGAPI